MLVYIYLKQDIDLSAPALLDGRTAFVIFLKCLLKKQRFPHNHEYVILAHEVHRKIATKKPGSVTGLILQYAFLDCIL